MKLVDARAAGDLADKVNDAIGDGVGAVMTVMAAEMLAAEQPEYAEAHDTDLTVIISTVPCEFAEVQTANQIGALDPAVVAAGDADPVPVVMVVDDGRRVRHQPGLQKTLEDNAAALIEELGLGLWLFRVGEGPTGTRLALLNPRHLGDPTSSFGGEAAILNLVDRNITVAPQSQWAPHDHIDTHKRYARDAARPHIAVVEGDE